MISIRLWQLVAVAVISGLVGGLIGSGARVLTPADATAAEPGDEARAAMDEALKKAKARRETLEEEARKAVEFHRNVTETRLIRFVDPDGQTTGTLHVQHAVIYGKSTSQLVFHDANGRLVWSAPQEAKAMFLSPEP